MLYSPVQPLDRVLVVDDSEYDMPMFRLNGTVHHQEIAIVDIGARHRVANHTEEESGDLVAYQVGIEIERGLRVFVGRRGEPSRDTLQQQRRRHAGRRWKPGISGAVPPHALEGGERLPWDAA